MIVCANAHPFEHILVSLQFLWCKHQGTSICLDSLHHHLCQVWNVEDESNRDMILVSPCIYMLFWFMVCLLPVEIRELSPHTNTCNCTFSSTIVYRPSAGKAWQIQVPKVAQFVGDPCLLVLFQFWIRMSQSPAILCDGLPNLMSCVPQMGCQNQGVTGLHLPLLFLYTLPETNINHENRPSQKETIPTIHFQVLC